MTSRQLLESSGGETGSDPLHPHTKAGRVRVRYFETVRIEKEVPRCSARKRPFGGRSLDAQHPDNTVTGTLLASL